MENVLISVNRLQKINDPFNIDIWDVGYVNRDDVTRAIKSKKLNAKPFDDHLSYASARVYNHVARIAWLVKNDWEDSIQLDVGVPRLNYHREWLITDGNHRFAAAIYRGDEYIRASISGQVDYADKLLGTNFATEIKE